MSEPLLGVVVSHGSIAAALVDAVATITGDAAGLTAVSNDDCSHRRLVDRIDAVVGARPTVVFVDLPGGSCLQASAAYLRAHTDAAVVAGVNLAMLLDFVHHRDETPAAAAARARSTGEGSLKTWGT